MKARCSHWIRRKEVEELKELRWQSESIDVLEDGRIDDRADLS